jgi:glyoxalase family protein
MSQERTPPPIVGLHHVTAIASDPQRNLDFYTQVLGLRLVKRTINFDDPGTYHFYFGDYEGSPGTILTFFPWPNAHRGVRGVGETFATAFSVPVAALGYWKSRLLNQGVVIALEEERFGAYVLGFDDPDGMRLELIGHSDCGGAPSMSEGDIPAEHFIRGFFGVTLCEADFELTASLLETMGFRKSAELGNRFRFSAEGDAHGRHIDVLHRPQFGPAEPGAGTVHHIAFRASDDAVQLAWRERIRAFPLQVTPVLDRTYFHSIYFHEPGGVLFEIATDPPGFAFDEPLQSLGENLQLPNWLESRRADIEAILPKISLRSERTTDETR